jgi:hypothetical protein
MWDIILLFVQSCPLVTTQRSSVSWYLGRLIFQLINKTAFRLSLKSKSSETTVLWYFYVTNSGTSNIIGTFDLNALPTAIACLNFNVGNALMNSGPR